MMKIAWICAAWLGLFLALGIIAAIADYLITYQPDSVRNDTASHRARCQSTSWDPEFIMIRPGEEWKVHSSVDCPVFDQHGGYIGCLRLPSQREGLTLLVSTADSTVPERSCP
jgi:hypothetical protein